MTESTLAAQLVHARQQHALIEELNGRDIPADTGAAYAVQHEVLRLTGARIEGLEDRRTSPSAQASGAPIDASLAHRRRRGLERSGHSLSRAGGTGDRVSLCASRCLRAANLYTRGSFAALGGVAVALEIVDSRFAQWPTPRRSRSSPIPGEQRRALVVGGIEPYDVVAPGFDLHCAAARVSLDGVSIVPQTPGNPAGDPRELLVWLSQPLLAHGPCRRAILDRHDGRFIYGGLPRRSAGSDSRVDRPHRGNRTGACVSLAISIVTQHGLAYNHACATGIEPWY